MQAEAEHAMGDLEVHGTDGDQPDGGADCWGNDDWPDGDSGADGGWGGDSAADDDWPTDGTGAVPDTILHINFFCVACLCGLIYEILYKVRATMLGLARIGWPVISITE